MNQAKICIPQLFLERREYDEIKEKTWRKNPIYTTETSSDSNYHSPLYWIEAFCGEEISKIQDINSCCRNIQN